MNKKYFFFDIDGTLTDRKTNRIVPSAQEALIKLQEKGHFVAIATGRAHYKARGFMESVGLKNMVCCGGAALVIENELLVNTPLPLNEAKALAKESKEKGYGYLLMLDDSIDVYTDSDLFIRQVGERQEPTRYIYDENLDIDKLENIYKLYLAVPKDEEDKLESLKNIGYLRFVPEYIICQYDAKDEGIYKMIEMVGGKKEDVVVFGDDTNDLIMFKDEWTSVAMGNACDKLKEKATYVADSNVNDGIYKICKEKGWID